MLAKLETEIPRGEGWTYEPKWDGFRTIVSIGDGVRFASRDGRPLGRYFPELVAALESGAAGDFVADGEIVRVADGAMEFEELQLRLHPADSRVRKLAGEIPATLVLFDLLRDGDDDLTDRALADRRERLQVLAARAGWSTAPGELAAMPPAPVILVAPWTADLEVAEAWFADDQGLGQDGVLAKLDDQPYRPGVRGWTKVKHRRTLDVVVGGYRLSKGGDGIGALLLGLYDDEGTLHYVGHTSSFKAAERREMLGVLRELEGGESFEGGRGPGGPSRWTAGRDVEWVPIEPVLVAEVSIDRMQYGRFRHAATFVRWRDDREPRSCTFEQLGVSPPRWPAA
jgi:ATP-dependent DNA ligase